MTKKIAIRANDNAQVIVDYLNYFLRVSKLWKPFRRNSDFRTILRHLAGAGYLYNFASAKTR